MAITIKRQDVLRSQLVPVAWYVVEVKDVITTPAKSDQSTNFNFKLEILSDDKGDQEFAGTPTKDFLINEKSIFSTGLAFLIACGFPKEKLEELKSGKATNFEVDERACVGKKIKAFVRTSEWEGRKSNECGDFLPLES